MPHGAPPPPATAAPADPDQDLYLWLEDLDGAEVMDWVQARNAETAAELETGAGYRELEDGIRAILDSPAKLPYIHKAGEFFYNFWRDAQHPRGLWRRTTLEQYRKAGTAWDVVLDLDALGQAEGVGWVFQGAQFLWPGCRRCLVKLSPGGSDAHEVREFDLDARTFVPDGFRLPLAKTSVGWIDRDTLFVATDFGPGSRTASGYPRIVRVWRRGAPLDQARTVFEARAEDMAVEAVHDPTPGFERDLVLCRPTFFTQALYRLNPDHSLERVPVPDDAETDLHRQWLLVRLRSPWTVGARRYPAGALLAGEFDEVMAGRPAFTVLFRPTARRSLEGWSWTLNHLILNVLDDVKNRLTLLTPAGTGWRRRPLRGAPRMGTVTAQGVDARESDAYFMNATGFLTPDSLFMGQAGREPERLKAAPEWFEAGPLEIQQHFVHSQDGTRVPYFQVSRKGLAPDGTHPVLLTGYGGFEVSMLPYYSGILGQAWLARGGVYVLANIRGGGEYGPRWHQAALRENRPRAFEDFAAVARDLVARGITTARRLGIQGGSNGGLLVGNMLVRHPDLVGAVVCQVPLLDMKRYAQLLAGASWVAEYGDPERPEDWAFLQHLSPFRNLAPGAAYPPVLLMTTTRDDRVHPAHARKMMARMRDLGCDVRYFENIEGGHGAGGDNRQAAHYWALQYAFLWRTLA